MAEEKGTKEQPWQLTTPSGTSEYTMFVAAQGVVKKSMRKRSQDLT
jgi:hypothetical protein